LRGYEIARRRNNDIMVVLDPEYQRLQVRRLKFALDHGDDPVELLFSDSFVHIV